jgi:hypothetical protein
MRAERKSLIIKVLFALFLLFLLAVEAARAIWKLDEDLYLLLSRFVGGGACLLFMIEFSFTKILSPIGNKKPLLWLFVIPGFIIAINNFLSTMSPTAKNDYTGIAKGYNLITICAESFSPIAISEEMTPTL